MNILLSTIVIYGKNVRKHKLMFPKKLKTITSTKVQDHKFGGRADFD